MSKTSTLLAKLDAKHAVLNSLLSFGMFIEDEHIKSLEHTIKQVRTQLESEKVRGRTIDDVLCPYDSVKFRLYKVDWWMRANRCDELGNLENREDCVCGFPYSYHFDKDGKFNWACDGYIPVPT